MKIPIDQIKPSLFATRPKPLEVKSLAESIKKFGQLQPIKVRPVDGQYECVFGTRRLAALEEAGFTEVDAIVQDLDDRQARLQIWEENQEREDLDDVARGEFLKAYKTDYAMRTPEMAIQFGIGERTIRRLLRVIQTPEAVRTVIASGRVRARTAEEIIEILGPVGRAFDVIKEAAAAGLEHKETAARARAIKYRQRTGRFKTADEDWQALPSVKQMIEQTRQLREWLRIWQAMVAEEKFAPEAKQFIARRVRNIGKALLEWADELEGENR